MFSYFERLLDIVPRWSIAPRINPQTVAAHSFFCALYTSKLCQRMQLNEKDRLKTIEFALRHDMAEAQTGDSPGPVKRQIVDRDKLEKFERAFTTKLGSDYWPQDVDQNLRAIVKAADLIDELFWLSMECMMGNQLVAPQRAKAITRLSMALNAIGQGDLLVELLEECSKMARGIDFPQNNDDLRV